MARTAELQPNHYVVRDANKQQRSAAKLLSKDEAGGLRQA
jgi:hypothetical protein